MTELKKSGMVVHEILDQRIGLVLDRPNFYHGNTLIFLYCPTGSNPIRLINMEDTKFNCWRQIKNLK